MAEKLDARSEIPEIWFRPDDGRSIAQSVARYLIYLTVLLLLTGVLGLYYLFTWNEQGQKEFDGVLASSIASVDPTERPELLRQSQRDGILIAAGDEIVVLRDVDSPSSTRSWHNSISAEVGSLKQGVPRQFSTKRNGSEWLHSAALTPNGDVLVVHRPAPTITGYVQRPMLVLMAWLSLLGLGLFVVWWRFGRRVTRSLQALAQAFDDLAIRGSLRPSSRQQIESFSGGSRELKLLGRSLEDLDAELAVTIRRFESLLTTAQTLGKSLDVQEVLDTTLALLHELLDVPRSAIFRMDSRGKTLSLIAAYGHHADYLQDMTTRQIEPDMPSAKAIKQGRVVQVADAQSVFVPTALRNRAAQYGYRSVMAIPFPAMGETPVVLIVQKAESYTYSYNETELIQTFAALSATALKNAQRFDSTDRNLDKQTSRLLAIVESVDDAIVVVSDTQQVIYANQKMRSLLPTVGNYSEGMSSDDFFEQLLESSSDLVDANRTLEELNNKRPWVELVLFDQNGEEHTFRVRSFSAVDREGTTVGHGQVWTDVTEDRVLDRMKSGLLATVSHEFRTPLTLIKGYATTLLADDVQWGKEDRSEFLQMVTFEADRLTELVKRLLDMRRIDAGLLDLQLLPVELDDVISSAIAGTVGSPSSVDCLPLPDVAVLSDSPRLVTALRNIIENARTHTQVGTSVTVGAEKGQGFVTIWIQDRGPGVPPEFRKQIFDSFFRTDSNLNSERSGIGLGLAIAQGFIEAHDGKLWVEDGPDNVGSVFYVQIPTSPVVSSGQITGTVPAAEGPTKGIERL